MIFLIKYAACRLRYAGLQLQYLNIIGHDKMEWNKMETKLQPLTSSVRLFTQDEPNITETSKHANATH